jgi:hypothetical protein
MPACLPALPEHRTGQIRIETREFVHHFQRELTQFAQLARMILLVQFAIKPQCGIDFIVIRQLARI